MNGLGVGNVVGDSQFHIRSTHDVGGKSKEVPSKNRNQPPSKSSKYSTSSRSLHSLVQNAPANDRMFSTSFHVREKKEEKKEKKEEDQENEEEFDDNASRSSKTSHATNTSRFVRGLIRRHHREYNEIAEETNPFLGLHHPNHNDVYFGGGKTIFTGRKARILKERMENENNKEGRGEEEEEGRTSFALENQESRNYSPKSRFLSSTRSNNNASSVHSNKNEATRWQDVSQKTRSTYQNNNTNNPYNNNTNESNQSLPKVSVDGERKDSIPEEDTRLDMKSVIGNEKNLPDLAFSAQVFKKLKESPKASKSKGWINLTIPVIDWLLLPVLFVSLSLLIVAFIFLFAFEERVFTSFGPRVPTYIFVFWLLFMFVSFTLIHFTVGLIFRFVKGALSFSRVFYFINSNGYHYTFLLWGILNLVIWNVFFIRRAVDNANFWIVNIFTSVIVIGACYIVVVFISKYVVAWIQREEYWKSLIELMFQERILSVLTDHPRRRKLSGTKKPSSHGFVSALKYLKKAYKQEQKNQRERRETRTFEEAIEVAQQIFDAMDVTADKQLSFYDFAPFFEDEEAAEKAFDLFDRDKSGGVTMDEVITTVYQIFKNRKTIYKTMDDREDIARIITRTFRCTFWVIMVFVVLLIFDVSFTNFILPITTLILALSFIFGESLKTLWESFIFIFVIKPFEVGDRFTDGSNPTLTVVKITLLTTICYAFDGRMIIYPNSLLYRKVLYQYKRSRDYACLLGLSLDIKTTKEQIEKLKIGIDMWLHQDQTSPWKADESMMWISGIDSSSKILFNIWAELRDINWQSPSAFLIPQSNLLMATKEICAELNILFLVTQPISVTEIK